MLKTRAEALLLGDMQDRYIKLKCYFIWATKTPSIIQYLTFCVITWLPPTGQGSLTTATRPGTKRQTVLKSVARNTVFLLALADHPRNSFNPAPPHLFQKKTLPVSSVTFFGKTTRK